MSYETIHPPTDPQTISGKAIAGLVLGIFVVLFPFAGLAAVTAGIIGLVFSIEGKRETESGARSGRGLAIAGLVLSLIGAGLYLLCGLLTAGVTLIF